MDGLVKGLINVALDAVRGDDDDRDNNNDQRDERSRSTWAQVAAGETDNNEGSNTQEEQRRHSRSNEWGSGGSRTKTRPQKEEQAGYGRSNEWESGESRTNNRPQKVEGDEGNDGWQTVQKKPSRQQHKVIKDQWNNFKRPADEQEYSSEVDNAADIEPSREELNDLSKALTKLWELDANRLTPGRDYEIDCGEGKKVYQKDDMAEGCLFSWLSEDVFRKPTYSRFCSLLDNYNPQEGSKEVVTSQEKQEQAAFIEEISRSAPIKYLHKILCAKGVASEDRQEFKRMLTSLWFDLYSRGGTSGSSSAFEHVFVGEIKNRGEQAVSGFHNWIQFYMEEAKGRVDYQGYIFPRRRGNVPDSETQLLTLQFEWNGVLKSVSSTLVGVSPEFEIAIYTLCFYFGGEDNYVEIGPYSVNIKCYRLGNKIGSVFPVAES